MQQGLIQIYTGDGKGKSTAAFGLAIRAAGRGKRVMVLQFLKTGKTGELLFLAEHFPGMEIRRFHSQDKYVWLMNAEELEQLTKETLEGVAVLKDILENDRCDVLILDEFVHVVNKAMISWAEAKNILENRPAHTEIILTGRNASAEMVEFADLVTEMKKIKHPFDQNVPPRIGIEL